MRRLLMSLTALALLAALGTAQAVEVRFYPSKVRPYELDPAHGVLSIVLQNIAIINDGKTDACAFEVAALVKTLKDAEELVRILHVEARAVVFYKETGCTIAFRGADLDLRVFFL